MTKTRPEYRPTKAFPESIELDCGCILRKEKPTKGAYFMETFCEEHDPSLWENYEGECEGDDDYEED